MTILHFCNTQKSDDNDDISSSTINLELKIGDTVHVQSNNGNYQENTDNCFQGYMLKMNWIWKKKDIKLC